MRVSWKRQRSLKAERLCAVRSSKAQRLKWIKPGYFNPPGERPIFVPGFNWLQILVIGRKGLPGWPICVDGRPGGNTTAPNGRKKCVYCLKSKLCGANKSCISGIGVLLAPPGGSVNKRFCWRSPKGMISGRCQSHKRWDWGFDGTFTRKPIKNSE
jgi:hypothetical protein